MKLLQILILSLIMSFTLLSCAEERSDIEEKVTNNKAANEISSQIIDSPETPKIPTPYSKPVVTPDVSAHVDRGRSYGSDPSQSVSPTPITEGLDVLPEDHFSSKVIAGLSRSVVKLVSSRGYGSGVIIDERGLIVTTYSLVFEDNDVLVELHDGSKLRGVVMGNDEIGDVSVIKIHGEGFDSITLGSTIGLSNGDEILALGYPVQGSVLADIGNVISEDTQIFSLGDRAQVQFLTSDIAMWDGSLGAPIFDAGKKLMGIMVADGLAISVNRLSKVYDIITKGENISFKAGNEIIYTFRPDVNADTYMGVTDSFGTGDQLLSRQKHPSAWGELSPSGKNLVYASNRGRNGNWDIYVSYADGSGELRLTHSSYNDLSPSWNHDGTRIVFTSDRDGDYEIYSMSPNGSERTQLTYNEYTEGFPHFNPIGEGIVFSSNRDGNYEIYTMDNNGDNVTRRTHNEVRDDAPRWNRAGDKFVFHSDRNENYNIYSIDVSSGEEEQITDAPVDERYADWSPDGESIVLSRKVGPNQEELFIYTIGQGIAQLTESGGKKLFGRWITPSVNQTNSSLLSAAFSTEDISSSFWQKYGNQVFTSNETGNYEIYIMNTDGSVRDRLTDSNSSEIQPSLSPDGKAIVFASDNNGYWDIYQINSENMLPVNLTSNGSNHGVSGNPAWSPDGSKIAYWEYSNGSADIYVMEDDGSNKRNVTGSIGGNFNPVWDPDGLSIVFESDRSGSSSLYRVNIENLTVSRISEQSGFMASADISPDGQYIVFESDMGEIGRDGNLDIYKLDIKESVIDRITNNSFRDLSPSWSYDGKHITYVSVERGNLDLVRTDIAGQNQQYLTIGKQSQLDPDGFRDLLTHSGQPITYHSFYGDQTEYIDIYRMNEDGTENIQLTNSSGHDASPQWSSVNDKILFDSDRDGDLEIYVMNADGTDQLNLSNDPESDDVFPSWTHDGASVVFQSRKLDSDESNDQIFIMGADGSGRTQLTTTDTKNSIPRVSPDGDSILFLSKRNDQVDIYKMDLSGSNQVKITDTVEEETSANWSPDGNKIVYTSKTDGHSQIYIMNSDGTNVKGLSNNGAMESYPAFSADGSSILFMSDIDGRSQIYSMNLDGVDRVKLTSVSYAGQPNWAH